MKEIIISILLGILVIGLIALLGWLIIMNPLVFAIILLIIIGIFLIGMTSYYIYLWLFCGR